MSRRISALDTVSSAQSGIVDANVEARLYTVVRARQLTRGPVVEDVLGDVSRRLGRGELKVLGLAADQDEPEVDGGPAGRRLRRRTARGRRGRGWHDRSALSRIGLAFVTARGH